MKQFGITTLMSIFFALPLFGQQSDTLTVSRSVNFESGPHVSSIDLSVDRDLTFLISLKSFFIGTSLHVPSLLSGSSERWPNSYSRFRSSDLQLMTAYSGQAYTTHNDLLGYYRSGKMDLGNKLSLYSTTYSPSKYYMPFDMPGNRNLQFNTGTSFEVGYKFSDKFSIRAGVTVRRFDTW
jgi:hypothetical protein